MQKPARKRVTVTTPVTAVPAVMTSSSFPWKWVTILAGILGFLLYANTLGHDYTVDDTLVTTKNKFTTQGIAGLGEIFTKPYRAGFWDRKEGLYRPLSVAMFAVEWELAGNNPFPGHLLNVVLYAITAMLVVITTRKLLKGYSPWVICAISFLYIVHPVHTEVVANIKSRDEILAFLFGLLGLYALLKNGEEKKTSLQLLAAFSFLLAVFSKENALTWIGVYPLALWISSTTDIKSIAMKMIPFALVAAFFMLCRYIVLNTVGSDYELMLINNSLVGAENAGERFSTAVSILGRYVFLLVVPATLVFDYSYNTIPTVGFADFRFLLSFLVIGASLIYALKKIAEKEAVAFGILFFAGTIILVSNIFLLIEATMAERFLYTPSYGFCIVAGILLGRLLKPAPKGNSYLLKPNSGFAIPVAAILLLFSVRTVARNADWKDNYTLLTKDVKSNPESARIRYAYGSALLFEKALEEKNLQAKNNYLNQAVEQLSKGVALIENFNDAWFHLGLAYKELNKAPEAVQAFEKARSLKAFEEASRFSNAGVAYGMAKQYEKAERDLRKAISMEPDSSDHYNNLGLYLSEGGKLQVALGALDTALLLNPKNDKAYYNKGNVYAQAGDYRQAMANYGKALEINPASSDAMNNTGNCYAALQQPDSALVWFEKAAAADPGNAKAFINLGVTYFLKGDSVRGQEYMARARSLSEGL